VVYLPLVLAVIPDVARRSDTEDERRAPVRWDRRMVQLAVLFASAWFIATCMSAHLPRLLQAFGMTPPEAVAAAALVGVAAVTMRFLEFTVLRRLPPLTTTRLATLLNPLGTLALLTLGKAGGPLYALSQGAGNGMLTVSKGVLPLTIYGPANYGHRSALLSAPAKWAQVFGPMLYGLLLERSGTLAALFSAGLCGLMFAMTFGLSHKSWTQPD